MHKPHRQGDVLVIRVDEFPEEVIAKLEPVTDLQLAEGEVTGHFHSLVGNAIAAEHGEDIFFEIRTPTIVTHQEHSKLTLPAGKYKKVHQVEYTPEAYRRVAD